MDRKKFLIILGSILGGILLIILVFFIISLFNGNNLEPSRAESRILEAGKSYFLNGKEPLPEIGKEKSVTSQTLTSAGYLKEMTKLINKNYSCSATVTVKNVRDTYHFYPYIDCGDKYKTTKFNEYLAKNIALKENGSGLYDLNGEKVYRGETPDNFVLINGMYYRILRVREDKIVEVLANKHADNTSKWDDRFNPLTNSFSGIKDYDLSRVREYLTVLEDEFKYQDINYLTSASQCIDQVNSTLDVWAKIECQKYSNENVSGLISPIEWAQASLDKNCATFYNNTCTNYNYLSDNSRYWTRSVLDMNQTTVYAVVNGVLNSVKAVDTLGVKQVLYISKDAIYEKGTGKYSDPYVVR